RAGRPRGRGGRPPAHRRRRPPPADASRPVRRVPGHPGRRRRAPRRPVRRAGRRAGLHPRRGGAVRPLRLEMAGFMAFRSPTVVDLTGAELFALVGPTGSGKTSVIDALTFALYGTVPRLDDRRAVAPVISQTLTEARVRLAFTVDDEAYTAVRVVRATRSGGATTKEARLQRGDDVLAGTADEVTEAVTGLLGLGFEHFTTCVSLPQGQFARFLHDKPRSRQDLLVRLLDLGLYEKVAAAARQRAALAGNRADVAAGRLADLAGATPEAREQAAARADRLGELERRLADERPRFDAPAEAERTARARADEAAERLATLERLAPPPGLDALAAELAEVDEAARRCAELAEQAATAVEEAEHRLAELPDRRTLEARRGDHAKRADLAATVERGEAAEAGAAAALEAARRRRAAAAAAHRAAGAARGRGAGGSRGPCRPRRWCPSWWSARRARCAASRSPSCPPTPRPSTSTGPARPWPRPRRPSRPPAGRWRRRRPTRRASRPSSTPS